MYIGGIEAGGTKFLLRIEDMENSEVKSLMIPTRSPNETFADIYEFFKGYKLTAIGVASFGPINLNIDDENFGKILNTPKLEWKDFNIYSELKRNLNTFVYINTDVALAGLGEYYNDQRYKNIIYVTIGTGIGAAIIKEGNIISGNSHSEMGHVRVDRYKGDNTISSCPYHDSCLEGLASGVSLNKRYNLDFTSMSLRDDIWDIEGYYIAVGIYNYILTFTPDIIYIGGGVAKQTKLIPAIYKHLKTINNNYINIENLLIKNPNLDNPGLIGAIAYARRNICSQK